ncbi:hypothetical protein ACS5PK_05090 [Roseateles sp. DB2]|uniref:hypothetical protein n=1 Tax=Roseateles sp. DB2 TaxID=3453717 RepID=UPI003EE94391
MDLLPPCLSADSMGRPARRLMAFVGIVVAALAVGGTFLLSLIGEIPAVISLGVTLGLIAGGGRVSLRKTCEQPAGEVAA